jgi:hypothetical protein
VDKNQQDIIFVNHPITLTSAITKKYRWTLANANHPNIIWWNKSLKTDYFNKKIHIEIYDDTKGDVFNWVQDLLKNPKSHSPLILTHFDNCGESIAFLEFADLKIAEHSTEYDYGTNNILFHKIIISYQKISRKNT